VSVFPSSCCAENDHSTQALQPPAAGKTFGHASQLACTCMLLTLLFPSLQAAQQLADEADDPVLVRAVAASRGGTVQPVSMFVGVCKHADSMPGVGKCCCPTPLTDCLAGCCRTGGASALLQGGTAWLLVAAPPRASKTTAAHAQVSECVLKGSELWEGPAIFTCSDPQATTCHGTSASLCKTLSANCKCVTQAIC
jgi:hypothetical protein